MDVITCMQASHTFQAGHCVRKRLVHVSDTHRSVRVYSLQIKQMFIVSVCVEKNKHSSNPLSTPLTEQSGFVEPASTLNYGYLPHTQRNHWMQRSCRTRQLCIPHTHCSSTDQRGQAEIRGGALCNLSLSSFTNINKSDTSKPQLNSWFSCIQGFVGVWGNGLTI